MMRIGAVRQMQPAILFTLPKSYEHRCLVEALQGIVNRAGPKLYLTTPRDPWPEIYQEKYGIRWEEYEDLAEVLRLFAAYLKGLVLYDEAVDGTRYVALTLAGIDDLLPVSSEILHELQPLFHRLGLKPCYELRGRFENSVAAYQWALEEVMPRANRQYAHAVNGEADGIKIGCGPFAWFDWVVGKRGFIFNLSPAEQAVESWGYFVGGDPVQAKMYRKILQALGPMAQIKGFGEPEWDWVNLFASYGHYSFHWGGNLSFHCHVPAKGPLKQRRHIRPEDVTVEEKCYITFLTSEGDTMKGPMSLWNGSWDDPKRGKVALNWGINPLMAQVAPGMLEYLYETATDQDYFFAGVSGAGYTSLKHMSLGQVRDFASHTRELMEAADLHCVDVWQWEDYDVDLALFAEITAPFGLTVLTANPPSQIRGVPLLGHKVCYWNANHTDLPKDLPGIAQYIRSLGEDTEKPAVIMVYTDMHGITNLPEQHHVLASLLGEEDFKVVRLDEAFSVLRRLLR